MYQPADGPAKSGKLTSVGTVTPIEVKVGSAPFSGRWGVSLQSTKVDNNFGDFYVYLADEGETPNAATVSGNGFYNYKNTPPITYEAGSQQSIWVLAVNGTVDIRISERG